MDEIEAGNPNWCPCCGEPHPHYRDGLCELCWNAQQCEPTTEELWHTTLDPMENIN